MAYKERVPVCGAIIISEYWDKVSLDYAQFDWAGLIVSAFTGAAGERMGERIFMVFSSRKDQQGRTRSDVCGSRGTFTLTLHTLLDRTRADVLHFNRSWRKPDSTWQIISILDNFYRVTSKMKEQRGYLTTSNWWLRNRRSDCISFRESRKIPYSKRELGKKSR